jgi:hypothetical protein
MSLTKATYSMINGAPSNVLDLGADSTGVSDSFSAFQTAGASSSTVAIPDGTFSLSASVQLTAAKSFTGNGHETVIKTAAGFSATPIFNLSPAAATDPKNWLVSNFAVTNNGSATSVFKIDLNAAGKYVSKFTLSRIISNSEVSSGKFVELANTNVDGLFQSVFSDNWSYGGYYLDNVGDSVVFERNTTTGSGVGYYINQVSTAANIIIKDGICVNDGGALNVVKGANITFDNMQVECPLAFTGDNNAAVSVNYVGGTNLVFNTKITNNNINTQNNPLRCIYLQFTDLTIIDGNQLYCNPTTGTHIYVDTAARNTIIGNNKYYNTTLGAEITPIIVDNGIGTVGVWKDATISLAGWTSQGATENPLGFFKDRDGTVHLRGRVAGAATVPATLFTLPALFRPVVKNIQFSAFGAVLAVRGEVQFVVNAAGSVVILTNNATSLDLNGISFSTR